MATNATGGIGLDQNQFMSLLLAGLQNQDPLEPMSNQDFLGQLAQFANLQGMQQMNANFSEMLKLTQMTQGSDTIGRTVQYTDASNNPASGRVSGLTVTNGQVFLEVGSASVSLDSVTSVGN
jgi:flagellar basal-body rod modification protein FlgD